MKISKGLKTIMMIFCEEMKYNSSFVTFLSATTQSSPTTIKHTIFVYLVTVLIQYTWYFILLLPCDWPVSWKFPTNSDCLPNPRLLVSISIHLSLYPYKIDRLIVGSEGSKGTLCPRMKLDLYTKKWLSYILIFLYFGVSVVHTTLIHLNQTYVLHPMFL